MDKLREFFFDKAMLEAVYEHIEFTLNEKAISRMRERKSAEGLADTIEVLDASIEKLRDLYEPGRSKPETENSSR